MIKSRLNKKKISTYFIIKFIVFILTIIIIIAILYKFYQSDVVKNSLFNSIEIFSQKYEYSLKKIKINKLKNIDSLEVEKYFNKYYNKSIFLIPIQEISKKIHKNLWVETVTIKSNYKNAITVTITELNPLGIYYNGDNYMLFDNNGKIIDFVYSNNKLYSELITFKGNNSLLMANLFLELIPIFLKDEIKEAVFINDRRWDITLKNGINLKLAENNILESLVNYDKIYKNISNQELQKVESIDLRISNKAILKFKENK